MSTIVDGHPFINSKNHASKGMEASMPVKSLGKFDGKRPLPKGLISHLKKRKAK